MSTTTQDPQMFSTREVPWMKFSTREVPWMKIGKLVDEPKTAAEAAKLGGLDFDVEKKPLAFWNDETKRYDKIDDQVAIVRQDTHEKLSIVGADYNMLQYSEAFDFMDQVEPTYVAAGTLRGGKQGFMVIRPDQVVNPDGDKHEMYVILRTSHDRSRSVEITIQSLRDRCMNQLTLRSFAKNVPHRWSIQHTNNMQKKLTQAHTAMSQLDQYSTAFNRLAERLMMVKPNADVARNAVNNVLFYGGQNRDRIVDEIMDLWHNDTERVSYNDTGWGLINAVSEHFEWKRQGRKDNTESRFMVALAGPTEKSLNKLTRQMLELAA